MSPEVVYHLGVEDYRWCEHEWAHETDVRGDQWRACLKCRDSQQRLISGWCSIAEAAYRRGLEHGLHASQGLEPEERGDAALWLNTRRHAHRKKRPDLMRWLVAKFSDDA